MFSGIVAGTGFIEKINSVNGNYSLWIKSNLFNDKNIEIGESIAVNGVCLTVVEAASDVVKFELVSETVNATTFQFKEEGDRVNLEFSLKAGDLISGHFVFGHVDGFITLNKREEQGNTIKLIWQYPKRLSPFIAPKGSLAIDGVSLTVGEVEDSYFSVYIIPHTAQITTLGGCQEGYKANLEVDMLARYVYNSVKILVENKENADI